MRDLYLDVNKCLTLGEQARKIIVGDPYRRCGNTIRNCSGIITHSHAYSNPNHYETIKLRVREVT